jgi:Outer membrane protein beta-barrel domain
VFVTNAITEGLMRWMCLLTCVVVGSAVETSAQESRRYFAGGLFGVSTLSADGRSITAAPRAELSLYKPESGLAVNLFAGAHLWRYFSLQANYMWNRNDVTLVSSFVSLPTGGFYEQMRGSGQHVFVADTLLYFRARGRAIRPYLGTGLAIIRFSSGDTTSTVESGLRAPAGAITATKIGLRSHVGIDLELTKRVSFRYSFSETISGNPISPYLTPAGERGMANFQNLFGLVMQF